MFKFLKTIFASAKPADQSKESKIEYKGFFIQPTPKNVSGGWSTEAVISKSIDGDSKTHHFIRADTTASKDSAIELTVSKARILIDQVGEQLFSK